MRSSEIDQLATALVAAQTEFEAVAKTADNPFYKSKFTPLDEVVKAAAPILTKHGLAVSQHIVGHEGWDGLMTMLLHSSGQFLESTMTLHLPKQDPQGQGSATTYGRRYAYMAVLGLVCDSDDDGNKASGTPVNEKAAMGAHRRSAPKAVAPTAALLTTTSSAPPSGAVGAPENRVGAADAKRELIADALEKGWDEVMAHNLAKKAWGDRGSDPVERGELLLLLMSTERANAQKA
jgi:hypothetical protein